MVSDNMCDEGISGAGARWCRKMARNAPFDILVCTASVDKKRKSREGLFFSSSYTVYRDHGMEAIENGTKLALKNAKLFQYRVVEIISAPKLFNYRSSAESHLQYIKLQTL